MPNGLLNFLMNSNYLQNYSMKNEDISENRWILGFSEIQDFHVKKSSTRHASSWGLYRKDPKGFLILTIFKGSSGHLKFEKNSLSGRIYFISDVFFTLCHGCGSSEDGNKQSERYCNVAGEGRSDAQYFEVERGVHHQVPFGWILNLPWGHVPTIDPEAN